MNIEKLHISKETLKARKAILDCLFEHSKDALSANDDLSYPQYEYLVSPTENQTLALAWRYNRIVKPEFAIKEYNTEFILSLFNLENAEILREGALLNKGIDAEFTRTGEIEYLPINCAGGYSDGDCYVHGDPRQDDDVQILPWHYLEDKDLDKATRFIDFAPLIERATAMGYGK